MNTDKLMELERKWRGMNCRTEAQDRVYRVCADELAALRAEQAVGDEQIARELLAEEMESTYSITAKRLRDPEFPTDGFPTATQAGIRAIRRALGAARQPENIGEFVIALLIAGGYVTQAKVDEARKIALSHGQYEMAAPTPPAAEDARLLDWLDANGFTAYRAIDPIEGLATHCVVVHETQKPRRGNVASSIREAIRAAMSGDGEGKV